MPLVDIYQAYDLHIHSNPSLFTRSESDLGTARQAAEAGLAGIMLKNHFESTVGRAALADEAVEGVRVFGGLVLNGFAGGLNPAAVENAVRLGAKQIWMPTLDAKAHREAHGKAGGTAWQKTGARVVPEAITVLNDRGSLMPQAKTIMDLCREGDVILGTAHLGREEIFALAAHAKQTGFGKLLITHPYFNPPKLCLEDQAELVKLGATLELCGGNLYPIPGVARLENYLETVAKVGARSLILTSDAGQPRKSAPYEVLRIFAQCLLEKGVSQKDIRLMTMENPARLLGL